MKVKLKEGKREVGEVTEGRKSWVDNNLRRIVTPTCPLKEQKCESSSGWIVKGDKGPLLRWSA